MKATKQNKMGFTLLELLIVILIIGLLSAISIPMYKKAVEKSKVSDALSTMQAVSKSEHGWYLVRNNYTKDFANLDIDLYDKDGNKAEDESFDSINYTYELLDSGILATRTNGEYSIYQDYDTKQIMCTPGTHFICDNLGAFTKEPCEKVGLAWANTNSTCYRDEEERCLGLYADELGEDIWKDDQSICGYTRGSGHTLTEGMTCKGAGDYDCQGSIIGDGAKCEGRYYGCQGSTITAGGICTGGGAACQRSIIGNGGICLADNGYLCSNSTITAGGLAICAGYRACHNMLVKDGGKIICSGGGNCRNVTYEGSGCCCGLYCNSEHKCSDSVCATLQENL